MVIIWRFWKYDTDADEEGFEAIEQKASLLVAVREALQRKIGNLRLRAAEKSPTKPVVANSRQFDAQMRLIVVASRPCWPLDASVGGTSFCAIESELLSKHRHNRLHENVNAVSQKEDQTDDQQAGRQSGIGKSFPNQPFATIEYQ